MTDLEQSVKAIRQWQRHYLLREYGDNGQVLPENLKLSGHIDTLIEQSESLFAALKEANEVLRSTHSIASRQGAETNWEPFTRRVDAILKEQHPMIFGRERADA